MTPRQILELAEELFPISEMHEGFLGSHHLSIDKSGILTLMIWYKNYCHEVVFHNKEDEDNIDNLRAFLTQMKDEIIYYINNPVEKTIFPKYYMESE